ncbi:helix-turn-helix transcriptional regulator [Mechercharimyces sp. CAU 1602]|uniref:helix-turn-helix domain-containing protein n=1 Tax=Mechercharimyces sp. CAU 1602 TaxID=2973933 RepID=UPI00216244ED|nr:helix-turn-helix domain-containing protein [Mechercharimyces sp. CAU 1602]MCS1351238.1 helix-turn-helix domain-containing protein [Mechercharimyces sp. CAU 1602]
MLELNEVRKRSGLSLEGIHKETKIPLQYIKAIEAGSWDELPPAKARLYLLSYAQHVGVDADDLFSEYDEQRTDARHQDGNDLVRTRSERVQARTRGHKTKVMGQALISMIRESWQTNRLRWWVIGGLTTVVLILSATGALYWLGSDQPKEVVDATSGAKDEESVSAPVKTDQSVEAEGDLATDAQLELVKPAELNQYGDEYVVRNVKTVQVDVKAKKDVLIRYRAGGPTEEITEETTMNKGTSKSFAHDEWVSIYMERPDQVELVVNGVGIDTSGYSKAQAFQLKRADEKQQGEN